MLSPPNPPSRHAPPTTGACYGSTGDGTSCCTLANAARTASVSAAIAKAWAERRYPPPAVPGAGRHRRSRNQDGRQRGRRGAAPRTSAGPSMPGMHHIRITRAIAAGRSALQRVRAVAASITRQPARLSARSARRRTGASSSTSRDGAAAVRRRPRGGGGGAGRRRRARAAAGRCGSWCRGRAGCDGQVAAGLAHDAVHRGQAEAGAAFARRVVKNGSKIRGRFGRDAAPVSRHLEVA